MSQPQVNDTSPVVNSIQIQEITRFIAPQFVSYCPKPKITLETLIILGQYLPSDWLERLL